MWIRVQCEKKKKENTAMLEEIQFDLVVKKPYLSILTKEKIKKKWTDLTTQK